KVECEAEPKAAVGWPDDPEIGRPSGQDIRIRTEKSKPELWETSGKESDAAGDGSRESGAYPGHALRTCQAASPDIRPHHSDESRAKSQNERNLQILQACAQTIASQSKGPKRTNEAGQEYHIQVRQHRVERTGQANAEDVPEQCTL